MIEPAENRLNPELDLVFSRITDLTQEELWRAWTTPEILMRCFCPQPWTVVECELEVWPGGKFMTVMQSPEGKRYPMEGCFLAVQEGRRLVWSTTMGSGFRPADLPAGDSEAEQFHFTANVEFIPTGNKTNYKVTAIHGDSSSREKHEAMGFKEGWGAAFNQLLKLMPERE